MTDCNYQIYCGDDCQWQGDFEAFCWKDLANSLCDCDCCEPKACNCNVEQEIDYISFCEANIIGRTSVVLPFCANWNPGYPITPTGCCQESTFVIKDYYEKRRMTYDCEFCGDLSGNDCGQAPEEENQNPIPAEGCISVGYKIKVILVNLYDCSAKDITDEAINCDNCDFDCLEGCDLLGSVGGWNTPGMPPAIDTKCTCEGPNFDECCGDPPDFPLNCEEILDVNLELSYKKLLFTKVLGTNKLKLNKKELLKRINRRK